MTAARSFPEVFSLAEESAVVTGGGTGLGFGIASSLIAAGASVLITGRREGVLASAAERLGPQAHFLVHDVTAEGQSAGLVKQANDLIGPVTILVNNAGIHLKKRLIDTSGQEFRSVLETHVMGAFTATRAFVPSMIEHRHGTILFIASMASLIGIPLVVAYSAAKSAYVGMVRTLAAELAPDGIRVNAIAPGWIQSPMLDKALSGDPARKARILSRTPMSRFGAADDIGWAAVYLCSNAAEFITGLVLPVDGGASIGF